MARTAPSWQPSRFFLLALLGSAFCGTACGGILEGGAEPTDETTEGAGGATGDGVPIGDGHPHDGPWDDGFPDDVPWDDGSPDGPGVLPCEAALPLVCTGDVHVVQDELGRLIVRRTDQAGNGGSSTDDLPVVSTRGACGGEWGDPKWNVVVRFSACAGAEGSPRVWVAPNQILEVSTRAEGVDFEAYHADELGRGPAVDDSVFVRLYLPSFECLSLGPESTGACLR